MGKKEKRHDRYTTQSKCHDLMLLHIGQHTFLEGHFFATAVAIVQLLVDRHHLAFHDVSTFVHNLANHKQEFV